MLQYAVTILRLSAGRRLNNHNAMYPKALGIGENCVKNKIGQQLVQI